VRTADIVCGVVLALVGLIVLVEGLRLGIGWSTDGPEAGFFIFYLGVALCLATGPIVFGAIRLARSTNPFVAAGQLRSVLTVFLPAVAMVVLTHVLGLYVSGAVYIAAYMRVIGRHRWIPTVLTAVAIPLVAFLIFEIWFLVPLPKGPLEARLGY
jgi:putative tricarboxylic transport membrane protein